MKRFLLTAAVCAYFNCFGAALSDDRVSGSDRQYNARCSREDVIEQVKSLIRIDACGIKDKRPATPFQYAFTSIGARQVFACMLVGSPESDPRSVPHNTARNILACTRSRWDLELCGRDWKDMSGDYPVTETDFRRGMDDARRFFPLTPSGETVVDQELLRNRLSIILLEASRHGVRYMQQFAEYQLPEEAALHDHIRIEKIGTPHGFKLEFHRQTKHRCERGQYDFWTKQPRHFALDVNGRALVNYFNELQREDAKPGQTGSSQRAASGTGIYNPPMMIKDLSVWSDLHSRSFAYKHPLRPEIEAIARAAARKLSLDDVFFYETSRRASHAYRFDYKLGVRDKVVGLAQDFLESACFDSDGRPTNEFALYVNNDIYHELCHIQAKHSWQRLLARGRKDEKELQLMREMEAELGAAYYSFKFDGIIFFPDLIDDEEHPSKLEGWHYRVRLYHQLLANPAADFSIVTALAKAYFSERRDFGRIQIGGLVEMHMPRLIKEIEEQFAHCNSKPKLCSNQWFVK